MLQPTRNRKAVNVLPCVVAASRRGRICLVEQPLGTLYTVSVNLVF